MSTQLLPVDAYFPEPPPPGQDDLPYDDGEPMETPKHRQQMNLLIESLRAHLHDRPDVFIGGNMGVYFSMTQVKTNDFRAPDFFVAFDVVQDRVRKSWVLWEEDGRAPSVVIELLSDRTEAVDRGRKMTIYAKALRVAEYYLFDPHSLVLEGYTLDLSGEAYRDLTLAPDGGYHSKKLGLRLVIAEGTFQGETTRWLRFAKPDGTILPSGEEMARAALREATAAQLSATAAIKDATAAKNEATSAKVEATAAKNEATAAKNEATAAKNEATAAKKDAAAAQARAAALAEKLRSLGINPENLP